MDYEGEFDSGIYYFVKNLQGDIVGIVDSDGNLVVEYEYDSWGKLLSITGSMADTIGVKNPYRYRGYRWDSEIGLYYLQSRYYDAGTGRFINADGQFNDCVHGMNMYAYCSNNPIIFVDSDGLSGISNLIDTARAFVYSLTAKLAWDNLHKKIPKEKGTTYCNVYVQSVMNDLGVPFGKANPKKGDNLRYGNSATAMCDGLAKGTGNYAGWVEVSKEEALYYANLGYPSLATWRNQLVGTKLGKEINAQSHIQLIIPHKDESKAFAQYGAKVYFGGAHMTNAEDNAKNWGVKNKGEYKYYVYFDDDRYPRR